MLIQAIGVATQKTEAAKNWERGMRHTGIPAKLVGIGQPYSFDMKIKLALEEMKANTEADIFITSDVYDVLINKEVVKKIKKSGQTVKDHILHTFQSFDKPIVVGAEVPCFSHNCYEFNFTELSNLVEKEYKYPNSGLIIGYRDYMIDLYEKLKDCKDDQMDLGEMMNKYPELFALDTGSKLFYNVYVYPDKERLKEALFVHFPGMKYIASSAIGYNDFQAQGYQPLNIPKIAIWSVIGFFLAMAVIIYLLYKFYWGLKPSTRTKINYPIVEY
jgi:hypothetical protein